MRKTLLFFIALYCGLLPNLLAQYNTNQNKVWAFGYHAGLDFNSGSPIPISTAFTSMDAEEGCASVSDINGNLLFYTNGKIVYNRNGLIMPHGDSIVRFCTASTTQATAIVPVLSHSNQYYVFSLENTTGSCNPWMPPSIGHLSYSIIDMSLDGGFGDADTSTMGVPLDSFMSEKMTIVAGRNCDIWLVTHSRDSARFFSYHITNSGISVPVVSSVGIFSDLDCYVVGVIKASVDGQRIVCQLAGLLRPGGLVDNGTQLYDFDATSGSISNCRSLDFEHSEYGADFSPDNTKLYTVEFDNSSSSLMVSQYDVSLPTTSGIAASKVVLSSISGYYYFGDIKLAPDNKIYFHDIASSYRFLACINNPNLAGSACGYTSNAIDLWPNNINWGLPNLFVNIKSLIYGPSELCVGASVTFLDSISGGTWSSSNPLVATIGSASGTVIAVSAGVASISYNVGGCAAVSTVSVVPTASPNSGNPILCVGHNTTLVNPATGGTWSSGNISVADVGSVTGIVTGASAGTATVTYSLGIGCSVETTVNVISALPPIFGDSITCGGASVTFSNSIVGGNWVGSYTADWINFSSGVVSATYSGIDTITYTMGGCTATKVLTVNPSPEIDAPYVACMGFTFSVSATPVGGMWSIDSSLISMDLAGLTTGLDTGNAVISYTNTLNGCSSGFTINIIAAMPPITGYNQVCVGNSIVLNDTLENLEGGTWSESSGAANTGLTYGDVTGVFAGTDIITYSVSTGCPDATYPITVNPLPAMISGAKNVCIGDSLALTDSTIGGTWSSNNAAIASIGSVSGVEMGVSYGSVQITYTNSLGCSSSVSDFVIFCPSEIPAISKSNEVYVYPNPAQNELTVSSAERISEIEITNLLGQTVYINEYFSKEIQMDVADLPSGLYFIKINRTVVKKFIKQ